MSKLGGASFQEKVNRLSTTIIRHKGLWFKENRGPANIFLGNAVYGTETRVELPPSNTTGQPAVSLRSTGSVTRASWP